MVPKDPLIKLPVTLMLHVTIIYALTQSQFEVFDQKMKFSIKESSVNMTRSAETVNLVIFTEEILNGKLHFLCSH